jgi:hypothetical protein
MRLWLNEEDTNRKSEKTVLLRIFPGYEVTLLFRLVSGSVMRRIASAIQRPEGTATIRMEG